MLRWWRSHSNESVITFNHSHQHDRYLQPLHSRNFKAGGLDMQGIDMIRIIYNEQFLAFWCRWRILGRSYIVG